MKTIDLSRAGLNVPDYGCPGIEYGARDHQPGISCGYVRLTEPGAPWVYVRFAPAESDRCDLPAEVLSALEEVRT